MITQIKASTLAGREVVLPVLQDDLSGLTVRSVVGLDPVPANIVTSSFALLDGSNYQTSSLENRNIVLTIGIEPYHGGNTVKELRELLYTVFMPKNRVDFVFYDHSLSTDFTREYGIFGYVESFEMNMFSMDPEAVISVICTDPAFYDLVPTIVDLTTTQDVDMFELDYLGTASTGIKLTLPITQSGVDDFVLYRSLGFGDVDTFDVTGLNFAVDDVLELSTVTRKKSLDLTRGATKQSVLYVVDPISRWINLEPGINYIRLYTNVGEMDYTIEYTTRYGGL